jgi:uncharacterized protein
MTQVTAAQLYKRRAIVVGRLLAICSAATVFLAQGASTDSCAHPGRRFVETAVTVGSDTDGLTGALTRPCGPGPFPAAVIVGGSGPTDRNGTSPEPGARGATPYRDLGRGLAARGVVVLRYDKRPCDHPQEFPATSEYTVDEESLRDAATAIALLQHRPEVDPARVFVVGHSEGGTVAPRIALGTSVAGVVLLAAAVEPLQDALLRQLTYLADVDGTVSRCEQTFVDDAASTAACVRSLPSSTTDACPLGLPRSYWLDLAEHDPAADAHALSQPILVLQGGRDYQVIPCRNFDVLRQRLADRPDNRFILYPRLDHDFTPGGCPPRPEDLVGRVAGKVVRDIARFVHDPQAAVRGAARAPDAACFSKRKCTSAFGPHCTCTTSGSAPTTRSLCPPAPTTTLPACIAACPEPSGPPATVAPTCPGG